MKYSLSKLGNQFRLQTFGGRGEILDIREENRQFLSLGMNGDVLLAAENALVDLGRNIPRDLQRKRGEKVIGRFQFAVHALNLHGLAALHRQKRHSADGGQSEIGEQVFERKDIRCDRLRDRDLLDAADVADFPVALWALRMHVVTADAGRPHDDRRDQPHTVTEQ